MDVDLEDIVSKPWLGVRVCSDTRPDNTKSFTAGVETVIVVTVGTRFNVLEGTRVFWTLNPSVVKSNSIFSTISFSFSSLSFNKANTLQSRAVV